MRIARTDGRADPGSEPRWDYGRDVCAAVLLVAALLLPWNLSFGVGVPDSSLWLFVLLVTVTLSSGATLIATYARGRGTRSASPPAPGPARLRFFLNLPYLLVVAGFLVFALVQSARLGGTGDVAPGVGPGLLVGMAGALLAAQPPAVDVGRPERWLGGTRVIGLVAAVVATLAVLANLYWRTRYPLAALADGDYAGQNIAVVATTVVYGLVAWVAVVVGLRWTFSGQQASRLATVALGVSTLLGGVLVWVLPLGRDIDAFHGIAQPTSTAAVGFEGYVAWVAVAAIAAPWVLRAASTSRQAIKDWREVARKCLGLIALWCVGSALLRISDLIVAASLDLPYSAYDSIALLAFDIVAAAAALWIRFNINGGALHPAVLSAGAGVLFVLTVCRVAVGVGLAPRILYMGEPEVLQGSVYGNTLAQQITSTFDVVLCWLALGVVAITVMVLQLGGLRRSARASAQAVEPTAPIETAAPMTAATAAVPTAAVPTTATPAGAAPKIVRSAEAATQKIETRSDRKPRINRVLEESTQRFAAGTTYTGPGPNQPPPPQS